MKKIEVLLTNEKYNIYIEKGLFESSGKKMKEIFVGEKITIITDDNVNPLYGEKLKKILEKSGFEVNTIVLAVGEKNKNFVTLNRIYKELIKFQTTRSDMIVALGGGVVGDVAGFAASTYMRGISYVQIPTSLIAQVDSSVGGKVAINLEEGKNLVGSFYQPKMVLIDPDLLKTLEQRYFNDGMAEVIKYACISDKQFFELLVSIENKEVLDENITEIICRCCEMKKKIVQKDERDKSERMLLNFGHTIGHAIEKIFKHETYTHGEAISIGMYLVTTQSENLGLSQVGTAVRIKELLTKFNLPYEIDKKYYEEIRNEITNDKKREGRSLNLILLKTIGEGYIMRIPIDEVNKFIETFRKPITIERDVYDNSINDY
ncbi:MAG: 3-dehydroquinate synthase [Clostridiales bacterium]|nr:3-dehydroquinate synthase [Clostridiales bacterium]